MVQKTKPKAKPEQAKSDPVVEALQRELKQQGFFPYEVDGRAGEKTTQAVAARDAALAKKREEELAAKNADTERLKAEAAAKTAGAQADATATETARKQRYDDQASSGLGMATQSGANLVAPAAGTALGMALGKGVNKAMDASQESKNKVLQGAARDRLAGITTRDGAREGARLAGAMPINNTVARTASRMAPHLGLGGISIAKGAQVLSESDPNGEFYPQMADRAAGLGYIGVGAGLGKQGLRYAFSPGVAPDAQSIAIINSNQLRRDGAPGALARALSGVDASAAPAQPQAALAAPEAPMSSTEAPTRQRRVSLQKAAQALGAPSGLKKAEAAEYLSKNLTPENRGQVAKALGVGIGKNMDSRLAAAIKDMASKRGVSSFAGGIPAAAAAGIAFAATPDEAMAADGTTRGGMGEAATNAAVAGGIGAGVGKLAQALGPVSGMMSEANAPALVDSMTEDFGTAEARNTAARYLPSFLHFGAVKEAADMAQVPSRGARDDASMIARQRAEQAQAMPMANAAALEIPSDIPAPRADGASPYGPAIEGRLRRMIQTGATPEQLTQFLNQAVR